jgi:hypothetical protein
MASQVLLAWRQRSAMMASAPLTGAGENRGHRTQTARRVKAGLTAGAQVTNGLAAA